MAAQAVHTTNHLDHDNCVTLVKCMLQLSINNIAYLRGLFPETAFHPTVLDTLDKLTVQFLQKSDDAPDEVQHLLNWFEEGVLQAVDKGYLKTLLFGIAEDAECTRLIEVYKFHFVYSACGMVSMNIAGPHGEAQVLRLDKNVGLADVQKQMIKLIRTSVMLCQTLSPLPDERYLFMKLLYHDHVPSEYEPPFFRPAPDAPAHFVSTPLQLALGSVETPHTAAHVSVTSVCDRVITAARTNSADVNCVLAENLMRELSNSRQDGDLVQVASQSDAAPSVNARPTKDAVLRLVTTLLEDAHDGRVSVGTILAKHPDLHEKDITTALKVLQKRGMVRAPRGTSRWYSRCVDNEDEDMATSAVEGLQRLRVGGVPTPAQKQQDDRRLPLADQTNTPQNPNSGGVFFCSQESRGTRRPAKASVVQEAVHQTKRRRVMAGGNAGCKTAAKEVTTEPVAKPPKAVVTSKKGARMGNMRGR